MSPFKQIHRMIVLAVRKPTGFTCVLTYDPTEMGKSKMIETIVGQITEIAHSSTQSPISTTSLYVPRQLMPILVIKADPPDQSVFNRGYYYRTALTFMGEPTYQRHLHMDIHSCVEPVKRRPPCGKAAESNDLPELKEADKETLPWHGVREEAHHG
jgi:hypothetical protein